MNRLEFGTPVQIAGHINIPKDVPIGSIGYVDAYYEEDGAYSLEVEGYETTVHGAFLDADFVTYNPDAQIQWAVGQTVYDVGIATAGVVDGVAEDHIIVAYEDNSNGWLKTHLIVYTLTGARLIPEEWVEDNRVLFFSPATITGGLLKAPNPFIPTLKKGDLIAVYAPPLPTGLESYIMKVDQEFPERIRMEGGRVFFKKGGYQFHKLGQRLKF